MKTPDQSASSAALIAIAFLVLLVLGWVSDSDAIPPPLNGSCPHAEAAVREQSPIPEDVPPPSKQASAGGASAGKHLIEQTHLELLAWNQLSPRAGFGLTSSRDAETWARRLGAGWYVDWTVQRRYGAKRPEHWQMVRLARGCVAPSKDAIRWLAKHYPGGVWVIGNEPDNIWQDNVVPEEYAQVYHDLYYLIKEIDPTASIAVAGVTQASPLRLAYLDRVLTAYGALYNEPMPVDWWTVHGFVVNEEKGGWGAGIPTGFFAENSGERHEMIDSGSLEYFQGHILAFRTWMAERGYRDKPLAVTEFGILASQNYGYTPEMVAQYLWDTFSWLGKAANDQIGYPQDGNRLVQRWAWFSLSDPLYPTSNLANMEADALTDIGWAFRQYVEDRRP